jgi:hypothetical protein
MPEVVESDARKLSTGGDRSVYRFVEVIRIDEGIPAYGQPCRLRCENEPIFVGRGLPQLG